MTRQRRCRLVSKPRNAPRGGLLGWIDDPKALWNAHATLAPVVKAALTAALYPQIASMDGDAAGRKRPAWFDNTKAAVAVHPGCMLHPLLSRQFLSPYLVFSEKMKTTATFLRDVSVVSPMALLLFGGDIKVHHDAGYMLLDGWLKV